MGKKNKNLLLILLFFFFVSCKQKVEEIFERAERHYRAGNFVESILAYSDVIVGGNDDLRKEAYFKIGLIHYVNLNNYEKSIQVLEAYLKKYPKGQRADEVLKLLGDIYFKNYNNYTSAIVEYQKVIENYPQSRFISEIMFNLGKAYFFQNNFGQAIIEFNKLVQQYPDTELKPQAELEIAACYNLLGNQNKAVELYNNLIKKYKDNPNIVVMAKFYLANIYEETEQLSKALKIYKTIQFTHPNPSVIKYKIDRINYRRSIQKRD